MPPRISAFIGLMKPAAGVTATRPTTIAVAAPTAVGLPERMMSRIVQTTSVRRRREHRRDERQPGDRAGRQRAAGVEAEPAEPEQPRAEQHERHVVREDRRLP